MAASCLDPGSALCSTAPPRPRGWATHPQNQPHGHEAVQARVVQLKALLEREVGVGQDLAHGNVQHSECTLLGVIQHLGRNQSQTGPLPGPTPAAQAPCPRRALFWRLACPSL